MEEGSCGADFPGFQTYAHKDDIVLKRCLSRLQRRAPCPLQVIKPKVSSSSSHGAPKSQGSCSNSNSNSSSLNPFYHSKDPIPLLSPLVLPSLLESACIQQEASAKSH